MLLLIGIFITTLGLAPEATQPSNLCVQQGFLNSISGHVSDGRSGIPNLQVELLNDMDSVIQRTKTDSSGLFAFRRLSTGIFQVRVQTYGTSYIGQTKRVQLERTRAFEQVDFVLGKWSAAEEPLVQLKIEKCTGIIESFATVGIAATMTTFNNIEFAL